MSKIRRSIALKVFSCLNHRSALSSKSSHSRWACPTNCFNVCATPASTGYHNSVAFRSPYQATPCSSDTAYLKGSDVWAVRLSQESVYRSTFSSLIIGVKVFTGKPQRYRPRYSLERRRVRLDAKPSFHLHEFLCLYLWKLYQVVVAFPQLKHTPGGCTGVFGPTIAWSAYPGVVFVYFSWLYVLISSFCIDRKWSLALIDIKTLGKYRPTWDRSFR